MKKEIIKKLLRVLLKTLLVLGILICMFAFWMVALETKNEFFVTLSPYVLIIGIFLVFTLGIMFGLNPTKNEFRKTTNYKKIDNIIIPEDIKKQLEKILSEKKDVLKKYRKKLKIAIIMSMIIFASTIIILFSTNLFLKIITFFADISEVFEILFFIIALVISIFVKRFLNFRDCFIKDYKKFIVSKVSKILHYNLDYNEDGNREICEKYRVAKFNDLYEVDTFRTTDYISGNISNNIKVEFCQMELISKGKNKFDSFMFAFSETEKYISEEIKIKNKEILIDENIKMDNQNFTNYFDVISENKILAMQVLTHDTMEKIIKLYEEYEIPFEMILKENKLFMKFYTGKVFEPRIFENKNEIQQLWKCYCIIKAITEFSISVEEKINKTIL